VNWCPAAASSRHTQLQTMSAFGDGAQRKFAKGNNPPHHATRCLDVPQVYWGKIIGTGGETLRKLQTEFRVSIRVPKPNCPNSMVTMQGTSQACDACEVRIQEIIQTMARSSPKPGKKKVGALFPKCALCGCQCQDIKQLFSHLCSTRHLQNVQEKLCEFTPPSHLPVSIDCLVVLLAEPRVRDLHIKLGYDVDAFISEAPYLEEKQLAAKLMHKQILSINPARD